MAEAERLLQSILVLILILLTCFMMINVKSIQGTARVVNYAGIVRGGTQRLVKLELAGKPNDDLIKYLDTILHDLQQGGGSYQLAKLNSSTYQNNLRAVSDYWSSLKQEILSTRKYGPEHSHLLEMSESYFELTNSLVGSAETFSQQNASLVHTIELCLIYNIAAVLLILMRQTAKTIHLSLKNKELNQKAYLDVHTSLPNKSKCELLLNRTDILPDSVCCIMFDLNNLKYINDSLGHIAGDSLILNFANILKQVIPQEQFVGRYGGDEFMAVLTDTSRQEVAKLLADITSKTVLFNQHNPQFMLFFAYGCAFSSDYSALTLQALLDKADSLMYQHKNEMKIHSQNLSLPEQQIR